MIQIYSSNNMDFKQNGDMTLFPETCEVDAEIGGSWPLTLTHPIDEDERWKYIMEDAVISAPTFMGEKQLFRIERITDKTDTEITVKAYPIFFDSAKDCFLVDTRPTTKNGQEALDIMTEGTAYSGESDITEGNTAYFIERNLIDCINGESEPTFCKVWGGEPLYDNYKIIINERAGGDYGAEVRYGKNMKGINASVDMSETVTRIFPVGYNGKKLSTNFVDSPLINNYPIPRIKKITFEDVRWYEDLEESADTEGLIICYTKEELDAALKEKCNEQFEEGIDLPNVTIDVDVAALENTEEYKDFKDLVKISLGDDVYCYNSNLNITTKARAIRVVWDCITDSVKEVTLGDYEYNFLNEWSSAISKIKNVLKEDGSVGAEHIKGVLNAMNTQLKYQNTAAQKQDVRAILFEDLDEESSLYGALSIGTQGIQISDKRTTDGRAWDWSTAITAKGACADVIIAGILADKKGKTYWNLDTGEFVLSPETKITWGQVTDTEKVANKSDIPTTEQITTITKDTVTAAYINALKIIAGSVNAENITGETITGKKFTANGTKVFKASDYTSEDLTTCQNIIIGAEDITSEILEKYDFTGKGYLNAQDLLKIRKMLNGEVSEYTLDISVEINGVDQNGIIKTSGVSIGQNGMYSKNFNADRVLSNTFKTIDDEGNERTGISGTYTVGSNTIYIANGLVYAIYEEV